MSAIDMVLRPSSDKLTRKAAQVLPKGGDMPGGVSNTRQDKASRYDRIGKQEAMGAVGVRVEGVIYLDHADDPDVWGAMRFCMVTEAAHDTSSDGPVRDLSQVAPVHAYEVTDVYDVLATLLRLNLDVYYANSTYLRCWWNRLAERAAGARHSGELASVAGALSRLIDESAEAREQAGRNAREFFPAKHRGCEEAQEREVGLLLRLRRALGASAGLLLVGILAWLGGRHAANGLLSAAGLAVAVGGGAASLFNGIAALRTRRQWRTVRFLAAHHLSAFVHWAPVWWSAVGIALLATSWHAAVAMGGADLAFLDQSWIRGALVVMLAALLVGYFANPLSIQHRVAVERHEATRRFDDEVVKAVTRNYHVLLNGSLVLRAGGINKPPLLSADLRNLHARLSAHGINAEIERLRRVASRHGAMAGEALREFQSSHDSKQQRLIAAAGALVAANFTYEIAEHISDLQEAAEGYDLKSYLAHLSGTPGVARTEVASTAHDTAAYVRAALAAQQESQQINLAISLAVALVLGLFLALKKKRRGGAEGEEDNPLTTLEV